jgi:hypothetical protein
MICITTPPLLRSWNVKLWLVLSYTYSAARLFQTSGKVKHAVRSNKLFAPQIKKWHITEKEHECSRLLACSA